MGEIFSLIEGHWRWYQLVLGFIFRVYCRICSCYWLGGGCPKAILGDRGMQRFKDKFLIGVKATGGIQALSARANQRKHHPHQARVVEESSVFRLPSSICLPQTNN